MKQNYKWLDRYPDVSNYSIHPGIRIPSRLYTLPIPFQKPKLFFPDAQFIRIKNKEKAHLQTLITLNNIKNLFAKQLPNMGSPYITRLVFDLGSESVAMLKNGIPIAAISSKFFFEQNFVEIAFCAVDMDYQSHGYGRMIMNLLKKLLQIYEIPDILTCADNDAVQYFKKQGFNEKEILMNPKRWIGYIKDYDYVTLVHFRVIPNIDYINFHEIINQQMKILKEKLFFDIYSLPKYFIPLFIPYQKSPTFLNISIPEIFNKTKYKPKSINFQKYLLNYNLLMEEYKFKFLKILNNLKSDENFKSLFYSPVTEEIAPKYFEKIEEPMDFLTIEKRLIRFLDYYKVPELFALDILKISNNCKKYNGENSPLYKTANDLTRRFRYLYYNEFPNCKSLSTLTNQ